VRGGGGGEGGGWGGGGERGGGGVGGRGEGGEGEGGGAKGGSKEREVRRDGGGKETQSNLNHSMIVTLRLESRAATASGSQPRNGLHIP